MTLTTLKRQLVNRISDLPKNQLLELTYFIEFLKLHEDKWFIDYINQRAHQAVSDKVHGKKFYSLKELQKEYKEK